MTETQTAARPSFWPIAEETLAAHPELVWVMKPGSPVRPATEDELKLYAERNADPSDVLHDATAKALAAPRPLRPAVAAEEPCPPPPNCVCTACVPPVLPGIGELDEDQVERLDRINELHDHEDRRTATSVMDAVDADPTELVPVVEPDSGERP